MNFDNNNSNFYIVRKHENLMLFSPKNEIIFQMQMISYENSL